MEMKQGVRMDPRMATGGRLMKSGHDLLNCTMPNLIMTNQITEKEEMESADTDDAIKPVEPQEAKIGDCTAILVDYVAMGKKWAVDGLIVLAPRRRQLVNLSKQPSLMISTREVLLTDLRADVTAFGMKTGYG